jgi:hypothetical protein
VLRLASLLLLLNFFSNLWADDFANCRKEVKKSYKFSQGHHHYKSRYGWLLFSEKPIKNYLRSEPLLGLYLLSEPQKNKALKVIQRHPQEVASITQAAFQKNRIIYEGLGLDELALLKEPSYKGTAVFGACCTIRGFVTSFGVVTSDYMLRFLEDKKPFATAGMRIKKQKGKIVVTEINPFFESNPFKVGDQILYMDGKKHSLASLTRKILFSKVGSKHYFRVKRQGTEVGLQIFLKERLGGGVLGETYLEQYGLRVNPHLEIISIDKGSFVQKMGLKTGDVLKSLNNQNVNSDKELRSLLLKGIPEGKMRLLFQRNGLQFSIFVPNNIMLTLDK